MCGCKAEHPAVALCGKQRLAIYYTTGSWWEINSHPNLHQIHLFKCLSILCNTDKRRKWLDGVLDWGWPWCDSDCANFQMSKKRVYWLRCIVACERRFRRYDLAYMVQALSIPPRPMDVSCREKWLCFVQPSAYSSTHILKGPHTYHGVHSPLILSEQLRITCIKSGISRRWI